MKHVHKVLLVFLITLLSAKISFSTPVELHYFIATVDLNDVSLQWGTFSEVTNTGFHVQRKNVDSTIWIEIGFVVGHGTTNEPQNYSFKDNGLSPGSYNYRLKQVDFNGEFEYFDLGNEIIIKTTSISNLSSFTPDKFILYQNYPNPFNPVTNLEFGISKWGFVSLKVYDLLGRDVAELVNENLNPGEYEISFDGSDLQSGVYYFKLKVGEFDQVRKMILLK